MTEHIDEFDITWKEQYNIYSANIGKLIYTQVAYEKGGYKIMVSGLTLKQRADNPKDGMRIATEFIKKQLSFLFKVTK